MTNPEATKTASAFRLECAVECRIEASRDVVWALLTDAAAFPRWNSTVTQLKGPIELGRTLEITVPVAPKRVFKPKVTGWTPKARMEWSDGFAPIFKGVRTFTLDEVAAGVTRFTMREVFTGGMLPLIKGSLPDFGPVFGQYAADLKRAAETGRT